MKSIINFGPTLMVLFFVSGLLLSSPAFADDWWIYEHDLTEEDLNFIDTEGYFAVGDNGVVLWCGYPTSSSYDPEWYDISPATSEDLYGVACDDKAHVAGTSGVILFLVGDWTFPDSPTTKDLYSVAIVDDDDWGFIVGADGTIIYGGGDPPVWELYEPSPTNQDLYKVCGDAHPSDPNTTWAVGEGGTILDYEDGVWSLYPSSPTTEDLYGVYVDNYYDVAWACGAGGTIKLGWSQLEYSGYAYN